MNESIIHQASQGAALNAEHYQTFEMAKANDGIIGGNDIAQIRSYAAYARAQAQAIHKTIAATSTLDDVAAIKAEATETAQTFAKVGIYADQRIGELLRELPKSNKWASNSDTQEVETKADAIKESGIPKSQAYDLQAMAANPEIVEAVIEKATEEGRVVSRKQVLDAINAKKRAESERDSAVREMQEAYLASENMELEVESLKEQLKHQPKPEVVTKEVVREVVPEDYEELKRKNEDLKREAYRLNNEYQEMWAKKREADKKLEQANELLGEKERNASADRDIEQLTIATNSYLRNYGGKAWAFDQYERVGETTQREFEKAINSLSAFAQNLAAMIQDRKQLGA